MAIWPQWLKCDNYTCLCVYILLNKYGVTYTRIYSTLNLEINVFTASFGAQTGVDGIIYHISLVVSVVE